MRDHSCFCLFGTPAQANGRNKTKNHKDTAAAKSHKKAKDCVWVLFSSSRPIHRAPYSVVDQPKNSPGSVAIGMTRFGDKHLFSLSKLRTSLRWLFGVGQAPLEEADDVDI